MRADNPLVDKQVWEVKDLKECNLVMISALHLPSYNSMIVELCLKYGFFPNIVYNAQNAASQIYNCLLYTSIAYDNKASCDGATSAMNKKVLLLMAIQKELNIKFPLDEVVQIKDTKKLTSVVYRQLNGKMAD